MARKYYALCDANCKFETMSKEQILTAITQAVNEGKVGNIDAGFITTIKTINGTPLKFFVGTQSEYELLKEEERKDLFAVITNDTTREGILETIAKLQKTVDNVVTLTRRTAVIGTTLTEAGFYHIRIGDKGSATANLDFGLIYWNNSISTDASCLNWKVHISKYGEVTIITMADIVLYGDAIISAGTEVTDLFDIYITKFGA